MRKYDMNDNFPDRKANNQIMPFTLQPVLNDVKGCNAMHKLINSRIIPRAQDKYVYLICNVSPTECQIIIYDHSNVQKTRQFNDCNTVSLCNKYIFV